jgi:hypothetical protein
MNGSTTSMLFDAIALLGAGLGMGLIVGYRYAANNASNHRMDRALAEAVGGSLREAIRGLVGCANSARDPVSTRIVSQGVAHGLAAPLNIDTLMEQRDMWRGQPPPLEVPEDVSNEELSVLRNDVREFTPVGP